MKPPAIHPPGTGGLDRRVAILLLLGMIGAGLPATAQDETEGSSTALRYTVRPLTYQWTSPGAPFPVCVAINNPRSSFKGQIEAWVGARDEAEIFRQPVSLGKGKFRFFLYPRVSARNTDDELFVRIVDDKGHPEPEYPVQIRSAPCEWSVLAMLAAGRRLNMQDLTSIRIHAAPARSAELLPDCWFGYRMFDAVFWDGLSNETLDATQRKALADWIHGGGRLILTAREGEATVSSPLPDLVPPLRVSWKQPGGSPVMVAPDFQGVVGPCFIERTVGLGRVILLTTDIDTLATRSRADLLQLFSPQSTGKPFPLPLPRTANAYPTTYFPRNAYDDPFRSYWHALNSPFPILARMAGFRSLNFTPILITMIVYILTISVVEYLALKSLRRLPWTWLTFPLLIAGFSLYSFMAFYRGSLGALTRQDLVYEDIGKDASRRVTALSCIRNNSNRPIEFSAPAGHSLTGWREASGQDYSRGAIDAALLSETAEPDGNRRITIPGPVGAFRFFKEQWIEPGGERPFTASLRHASDGRLSGSVSNASHHALTAAWVLHDGQLQPVDLARMTLREAVDAHNYTNSVQRMLQGAYDPGSEAFDVHSTMMLRMAVALQTLRPGDTTLGKNTRQGLDFVDTLDASDAAVIAFVQEESSTYSGMPVRRLRCIRQIIEAGK